MNDGKYFLNIDGSKVLSSATGVLLDADADWIPGGSNIFGESAHDGFFRLYGDSDGDRDVDAQDYGRFGLSFLQSSASSDYKPELDFDGDGDVDGLDLGRFRRNFLAQR